MTKLVAMLPLVLIIGCTPLVSTLIGGASSVWSTHERRSLEKRIEALEKAVNKEPNCLLLCDYPEK